MTWRSSSAASACAWCGASLDERGERLPRARALPELRRGDHRPVARRRRRSTAPTPTGTAPRPGASPGPGDRLLRRTRGHARPGGSTAIAPPGPVLDVGAGDGTLLDALRAPRPRGARARARLDPARRARGRRSTRSRSASRRSSSGTRSSTCARPARRSARAAELLAPGRRARGRRAERRAACRRARSATAGWRSTCPRHLVHIPPAALLARLRAARARGRAGEPPARRPGRVRLAARPGRPAPGPPEPVRRDPPPAAREQRLSTASGDRSRWCARLLLPVAAGPRRASRRRCAAAAPSTSRRASHDDRDAGERVTTPIAGVQPDLAAPRGRLRGSARAPSARAGARPRLRGRALLPAARAARDASGVDIDAEALAGQDRETVVADMRELPFGGRELRLGLSRAVDRARARPRPRARRRCARVLEPGGTAVFVTPNRLTFGRARRDHRPLPLRRVRRRASCRRSAPPTSRGRGSRAVRIRALPGAVRRRSAGGSTGCCDATRCACAGAVPRAPARSASTT